MLQSMGLQRVGHDWATEQQGLYSPGDSVSDYSEELMLEKLHCSFQHSFFFSFNQNLLSSNCVLSTGNTAVNKMGMTSALMSLQSSSPPAN